MSCAKFFLGEKMQKRFAYLAVAAVIIFATGCTLFDRQERRIAYTEILDQGNQDDPFGRNYPSLITDAKQRVIINMKAEVGSDGNGDDVKRNHPKRIICTEPSPDVAQAISAALTAAAQVDATLPNGLKISGSGSLGSSYVASIAQLGERLATVQLLRDKMYRACEAYQNGAITDTSYTLMLSRFDKTMASMLASEVAAGAFGRNLAALGGSASTGGVDPKKLANARDAVKAASDKVQEAAKQVAEAKEDKDKQDKQKALADAKVDLEKAVAALVELELQSAITSAQSGPINGSALGQIAGRAATDVADSVQKMSTNYLDDDASSTLIDACVVALDRKRDVRSEEDKKKIKDAANDVAKAANDVAKAADVVATTKQGVDMAAKEAATAKEKADKASKAAATAKAEANRAAAAKEKADKAFEEAIARASTSNDILTLDQAEAAKEKETKAAAAKAKANRAAAAKEEARIEEARAARAAAKEEEARIEEAIAAYKEEKAARKLAISKAKLRDLKGVPSLAAVCSEIFQNGQNTLIDKLHQHKKELRQTDSTLLKEKSRNDLITVCREKTKTVEQFQACYTEMSKIKIE